MGRKSSVEKAPDAVRALVLRLLRENRKTLDQIVAELHERFPELARSGELPKRSAIHRYGDSVREIVEQEREMAVAAEALVAELGEDFDSKAGALLAQAVTTLANRAAMEKVKSGESMEIGDILDMARAAKAVQEARSLNLRERQAVAKVAREKLLEEQEANLQAEAKAQGMDEAQVDFWRRKVLGIR